MKKLPFNSAAPDTQAARALGRKLTDGTFGQTGACKNEAYPVARYAQTASQTSQKKCDPGALCTLVQMRFIKYHEQRVVDIVGEPLFGLVEHRASTPASLFISRSDELFRRASPPNQVCSMALTRDQALAALGLSATPDADAEAIHRAFERLARRYPQPSFPERFRQLLEARDELLDTGRNWRELLENGALDLGWILSHLGPTRLDSVADRRTSLQDMLRAGYLAERLPSSAPAEFDEDDLPDIPF